MRFNREKFIEFLLKVQVTAEKLDVGAFYVYCWSRLRLRQLRRFIERIPTGALVAAAFTCGCLIEALSLKSPDYDTTLLNTATNCVGAALIIGPLVYMMMWLAGTGTHPLEGTRLLRGK